MNTKEKENVLLQKHFFLFSYVSFKISEEIICSPRHT